MLCVCDMCVYVFECVCERDLHVQGSVHYDSTWERVSAHTLLRCGKTKHSRQAVKTHKTHLLVVLGLQGVEHGAVLLVQRFDLIL